MLRHFGCHLTRHSLCWHAAAGASGLAPHQRMASAEAGGGPRLRVDHLVWVVANLEHGMKAFEDLTGVCPRIGGRHVGLGTHNALASLGNGQYFEILAADPSQAGEAAPTWLGVDAPDLPRLTTFCAQVDAAADVSGSVEGVIAAAREQAGYDPGPAVEMTRTEPDGQLVRWRLSSANHRQGFSSLPGGGIVPFLIDWSPCEIPTPTETSPGGCSLVGLQAWHPEPSSLEAMLRAMGAEHCFTERGPEAPLGVSKGDAVRLEACLETPRGRVTIS